MWNWVAHLVSDVVESAQERQKNALLEKRKELIETLVECCVTDHYFWTRWVDMVSGLSRVWVGFGCLHVAFFFFSSLTQTMASCQESTA